MSKKDLTKSAGFLAIVAIFVNVIWGVPFPLVQVMNQELGVTAMKETVSTAIYNGQVLSVISIRFIIAGIMTLLIAILMKQNIFKVSKKQWKDVTLMGLVSTTAAYFFFNIGLANTTSIKSTIISQSSIFFSLILAHFLYKNDRLNKAKWVGLIFGFAGLIAVNLTTLGDSGSSLFSFSLFGDGFIFIYGLVASLGMIQAKAIGSTLNTFVMTGWNLVIGGVVLLIIGLVMGGDLGAITWTSTGVIMLLILALISALAFGLWYWVLQYAKMGEVSMFKFVMPVSGSLMSLLLGTDTFTMPFAIGLVLVCIGIVVVNRPPKFLQEKSVEAITPDAEATK